MKPYSFHMPTRVYAGAGCLAELAAFSDRYRRPAIVCGRSSARESGALDAVLGHFPNATVLDGFPENPETSACESYAAEARHAGVDGVIGLGGGSVLDGAKAIALLAPNEGACNDYFGTAPPFPPLPVLAIPTTAGTGSEVTPYAVLVLPEKRKKKTLSYPSLFPEAAFLDPAITVSLPRDVTIATGLDTLSQGMEGMLSTMSTPVGDALALEVCRTVRRALPRVLQDPADVGARGELLYAAMVSGIIIAQSGTTVVHGMGYYYTLECGIAHGAANALLLPPVFQWNAHFEPRKVAQLAAVLGRPGAESPAEAARAIADALYILYDEIGFARAARQHGVPEDAASRFAADICGDAHRFKRQVGEMPESAVLVAYEAAWRGEVAPI